MTDQPINLQQLRAITYPSPTNVTAIPNDTLLALIDTAQAAREMADAYDSVTVYPEGSVGFENADEALARLRETLARYE